MSAMNLYQGLILSLLAFSGEALSQEIDRIYRSAYFLGRGDTGIATADGEDAIFYNPAGIAYGKGIYKKTVLASPMIQISNSTKDLAREIAVEEDNSTQTIRKYIGSPQSLGIYNFTGIILRRAALGLVASGNNSVLVYKSPEAGALESFRLSSRAYGGGVFTLADSFFDSRVNMGVTGKYLQKYQADLDIDLSQYEQARDQDPSGIVKQGAGGGLDFGLMVRGGSRLNPSFGLTIQDIGDTVYASDVPETTPDPNYQTVNIGFAVAPGTKVSTMRMLIDYRDILNRQQSNPFNKLHLGGEFSIRDTIGLTTGLNQGYATAGMYLDTYLLRFDLGFYTEETGEYSGHRGDSRLYFRLSAGF
jgi:hypothetical protein